MSGKASESDKAQIKDRKREEAKRAKAEQTERNRRIERAQTIDAKASGVS